MARYTLVQGTSKERTYHWVAWALFIAILVIIAFAYADTGQLNVLENSYSVSLPRLDKAIAFIIAVLGLQVVVGYTGQLALGQSFFFGTGAYLSAWLVEDQHWPWIASLAVVIPVCFVLGVAVGIPALRIKGLYLALVTLGLAAIFPSLVQLDSLDEYTAGAAGKKVNSDLAAPDWVPLDGIAAAFQKIPFFGQYFGDGDLSTKESDRIWKFFLFTLVAAFCFWMVANLIKSRPGRAIRAIRDNETSAAVSGVNLSWYKTTSFGVASALGGVGGIVYVAELGIASPGDFSQLLAIFFIVGLVVGGVGTLTGAVVGGFVIAFVPEWSSSTTDVPGVPERWLQGPTGTLVLGVLLILLTFVLPGGIVAGVRKLKARVVRVVPSPPSSPAGTVTNGPSASDDTHVSIDEVPATSATEFEDVSATTAPPG